MFLAPDIHGGCKVQGNPAGSAYSAFADRMYDEDEPLGVTVILHTQHSTRKRDQTSEYWRVAYGTRY